jgi:hypothetical protein
MKYYFKYEGTSAKVYCKSDWGVRWVATFSFGIDAEEYVKFKNKNDQCTIHNVDQ